MTADQHDHRGIVGVGEDQREVFIRTGCHECLGVGAGLLETLDGGQLARGTRDDDFLAPLKGTVGKVVELTDDE